LIRILFLQVGRAVSNRSTKKQSGTNESVPRYLGQIEQIVDQLHFQFDRSVNQSHALLRVRRQHALI
jgi:hypothetical protein